MAQLQRAKAECPLCRAAFPAGIPLVVNHELRDLIALAAALGTVEQNDGWQAITAQVSVLILSNCLNLNINLNPLEPSVLKYKGM